MEMNTKIQYLYHYYESSKGPFLNLSDLKIDDAQKIMDEVKANNDLMASHRYDGYAKVFWENRYPAYRHYNSINDRERKQK